MSDEVMDIPVDWDVTTLGEVNTLRSRTLVPGSFPDEVFEYYSIPDYQNGERPGRVTGRTIASAKLQLKPKSVLFGKLNPRVEKVWRVGPLSGLRQIGSTEWIPVLPDERMDPDFLYFLEWSDHVMPKAKTLVSGSTPSRQRVDPTSFYKIRVPLPPLPEQQRIAQVLSTVQEAIAQQERLIRSTTELKQALMQKLFTEGLRGEALKETEIGRVPESWEVVELGDVFKFTSGKPKPKDTTLTRSGERPIPVYGGNGIMGYTAELLLDHTTLILGRVGEYCGCAHLTEPKAWITDNALYVKEDKLKPNYEYLREHLDHLDLNQYSNKMGQPLITQGIIGKVKFGLPTRKEQDEIATALKAVENRIHVAELKRNALRDLFRTLLHELMTGKVRVGQGVSLDA